MVQRLIRRLLPLLLLGLLSPSSQAKTKEKQWVLGANAAEPVQAISRVLQEAVAAKPSGISLQGDVAVFNFITSQDEALRILLTKEAKGTPTGLRLTTQHGVFNFPPDLQPNEPDALRLRLEAVTPLTPWRQASMGHRPLTRSKEASVDAAKRDAILASRRRNLSLRAGRNAPPTGTLFASPISQALAKDRLPEPKDCPSCNENLLSKDPRLRLQASRDLLRTYPTEVRLWSLAAEAAEQLGRHEEALAFADVATRMSQTDALALQVWSRLTGQNVIYPPDQLPYQEAVEDDSAWLLLLFIFASLALLLLASSRPQRSHHHLGWAALAVIAVWAFHSTPYPKADGRTLDKPTEPSAALVAPLAGTNCQASPNLRTQEGDVLYATCDGRPYSFHVMPKTEGQGTHTKRHTLEVRGPNQNALTDQAMLRLTRSIKQAERDDYQAVPLPYVSHQPSRYTPSEGSLEAFEWKVSRTLVIVALLLGLLVCLRCIREWWTYRQRDRQTFLILVGLGCLTLGFNLFIPDRMVMVYTGYDLTERLAMFEATPRYGAGGIWLYEPFFTLFGVDHTSIQTANRVFGILSFPPLAAIVLRSTHSRHGLWILLAYVLLPLAWRDHTSEGIMSGTVWLMLSALAVFAEGFKNRGVSWLLPAAVWLTAAASTVRPEVAPSLPIAVLALYLLSNRSERPRASELVFLGLGFAGLLAGHGLWLIESAQAQMNDASILTGGDATSVLGSVLTDQNLLFDPSLFPLPWWLWLLAAPFARPKRWLGLGLMLLAATSWIAMSAVDLPSVSIPRVHLPALVFLVIPMTLGAQALASRRHWNLVIAIVAVSFGVSTAPKLLASSNAQEEDTLIRTAAVELKNPSSCLTTVTFSDPPDPGKTQRHFPTYLFPSATVLGLSQYEDQKTYCTGDRIALLGTRCFMSMRASPDDHVPADGELPVCKNFRDRYNLEPILEMTIPNRVDFTFSMYPARDELVIGAYRIVGLKRNVPR